jgi:hypothetical protein
VSELPDSAVELEACLERVRKVAGVGVGEGVAVGVGVGVKV